MSYEVSELVSSLKAARLEKGLSQRELSELSGVPQAQISKLENGQADVRISTFVAISRALGQEVEIIPRKHVPAVQAIVRRSHSGTARNPYALDANVLTDSSERSAYSLTDDDDE